MTPVFYTWPKLTAFDAKTIGSKVRDSGLFLGALSQAVERFDFSAETNEHVTTTGQGVVPIPGGITAPLDRMVYSGVGHRVASVDSYVLREWRGEVKPFLKRRLSAPVESLAAVVYTVAAYLADPDIDPSEVEEIKQGKATTFNLRVAKPSGFVPYTHVIVAVLAAAGPKAPAYGPGRLVANLAGGNNDALAWDADTIREHAKAAHDYASEWSVVAD